MTIHFRGALAVAVTLAIAFSFTAPQLPNGAASAQPVVTAATQGTVGTEASSGLPAAPAPPARASASMANDANGAVVLFGGLGTSGILGDTWTWDGATWTEQHPDLSPPARRDALMAQAVSGNLLLVGGDCSCHDQWAWDGVTWTEQHVASGALFLPDYMVYDAATSSTVLLSSGFTFTGNEGTWAPRHHSKEPLSRRDRGSIAYDAANGTVVLFGGSASPGNYLADTWTWDGSNWTKQSLAPQPG